VVPTFSIIPHSKAPAPGEPELWQAFAGGPRISGGLALGGELRAGLGGRGSGGKGDTIARSK